MPFNGIVSTIRGWRSRPLTTAAVVVLALGAVGDIWYSIKDALRSPDQRIIDAGHHAGSARTVANILQVADNICASLRLDHSLSAAQGIAGDQLFITGTDPTRWIAFIHVVVDNQCPDAGEHLHGDED